MSELIDTRGLSCPQPVLLFLNAAKADASNAFSVLVDNDASLENVSRAARNRGYSVETADEGQGITRLEIHKS
ncbi:MULTISPECIES: sulfurtransferase TusA family protein [Desulfovibrio]|uniref:TusA-related sulfurtransferase n=1 Tax=Desulfovibrio intestinalis TaxID=58621 RepID=A0A7W8C1B3_9BACT|nr:sulfurtransferase TusA family protein [Desulfovibrio intestinalis]MBB5142617.1 TusA-related sulfurtransferase [Desulfovibrio intestinalis]